MIIVHKLTASHLETEKLKYIYKHHNFIIILYVVVILFYFSIWNLFTLDIKK